MRGSPISMIHGLETSDFGINLTLIRPIEWVWSFDLNRDLQCGWML